MTLLLPVTPGVAWPTPLASSRWATITASTLYRTWSLANPGETAAVVAYWSGTGPRPTTQVRTAFGRHLVEHADDLRTLAGVQ